MIPVVKQHDRYLAGVLGQLSPARKLIDKIIVARSGLPFADAESYRLYLNSIAGRLEKSLDVQLAAVEEPQLAGANRNRGWSFAESE